MNIEGEEHESDASAGLLCSTEADGTGRLQRAGQLLRWRPAEIFKFAETARRV
jgi:hypothetical protein